jgi:hypothetical protein
VLTTFFRRKRTKLIFQATACRLVVRRSSWASNSAVGHVIGDEGTFDLITK